MISLHKNIFLLYKKTGNKAMCHIAPYWAGQKLKWGLQADVKNFQWLWLSGL